MNDISQIDNQEEKNMMYLYTYLLKKHDFRFTSREDSRYLARDLERQRQIEKLRDIIDPSHVIYNKFNPFHK